MSPTLAPGVAVIFSAPSTRAKRPRLAARKSSAPWMAAVPVAQAFSKRVIGLKRSSGMDCSTSEDGKALLREALAEDADEAGVDLGGLDAGIVDGGAADAGEQRFEVRLLQLAEGRMRPADDAGVRRGDSGVRHALVLLHG